MVGLLGFTPYPTGRLRLQPNLQNLIYICVYLCSSVVFNKKSKLLQATNLWLKNHSRLKL
jgi:hypothetical protein